MDNCKVTLLLALLSLLTIAISAADLPKPSYTRTMLKVSRSLPGETEELKVRTSEGNVATLIVKRRDRTLSGEPKVNDHLNTQLENQRTNPEEAKENTTSLEASKISRSEGRTREEIRKLEEIQIEQLRSRLSESEARKDSSGLRNDSANEKTVTKNQGGKKDQATSEKNIDYGNWTPLGTDGRAVQAQKSTTEGHREEYQSWKPLQSDQKTTTEERTNYARFDSALPTSGLVLLRHFQDRSQRNLQVNDQQEDKAHYTFLPHQIRSSRTNIGANLSKNRDAKNVPPEVVVRSEINVKTNSKRSPMTLDKDGTPVIHGMRVPDEPIDKIQTWRNARVINNKLVVDGASTENLEASTFYPTENVEKQRFERFFRNVNQRYGKVYDEEGKNVFFEWDPKNYKNEALKAEVYEPRNDNFRASTHKRMLHPEGVTVYPVSQLYTPESQKIAPVALKPGARAPVLQYAHPELGVQPAKILKNEKKRPENFPENQYSFTEQKQKKKYVLNDKTIIDSYNTKNYYPNQHFYGLKRPNDAPFWVKISENLKSQFSNGVEKVSQFTRPVIDPLVEATHKISQNLGLSKGKEAQEKVGTVATGGSILIPALGLVASGAALGIGAVAVGRYLDVDVLKRSNDGNVAEVEYQRALDGHQALLKEFAQEDGNGRTVYFLENVPQGGKARSADQTKAVGNRNDVLVIFEDNPNADKRTAVEDAVGEILGDSLADTPTDALRDTRRGQVTNRRKRSLDYLDIFKAEDSLKNLVRNKRLQRKGADSMSEIVEIDLPAREGSIDVTEFLIPRKKSQEANQKNKDASILVVEDGTTPLKLEKNFATEVSNSNDLENVARIVRDMARNSVDGRDERRRRSLDSDQELEDTLQNLENAEIAEVAHIDGDWTSTPCAKRLFCDAMMQRGPDASVLMEKKMAALLGLIQPGAAVQVSSHFHEVMDAVRRHDCSGFLCPQARPGNVFF